MRTHDEHLDMETAWAVGFAAFSLTDEEEGLLPEGANEALYCQVLCPSSPLPLIVLCLRVLSTLGA